MQTPFIGPSYNLESRPASVQRTINLVPVPLEPGNERAPWVLKDVPGLTSFYSLPAAALPIGWGDPDGVLSATYLHTNSGARLLLIAPPAPPLYAGVVGWAGETVAWSSIWAPTNSEPAPTLVAESNGRVRVDWPSGFGSIVSRGQLIVTATINGVPVAVGERLTATGAQGSYGTQVWGPEP